MIYPWQAASWASVVRSLEQSHHAILLTGRSGIGKREFALQYCKYLLCQRSSPDAGEPCGYCRNCHLFTAGTHPDFHVLTTPGEAINGRSMLISRYSDRYHERRDRKTKPGQMISVDQIRLLIDRFSTCPHISTLRTALILPADAMNTSAANALLKLLEEPPSGVVFILATAEPYRLLATIRSRCINHILAVPEQQAALDWLGRELDRESSLTALKLASGGPLDARTLVNEGLLEMHSNYIKGLTGLLRGRVPVLELASQLSKMDLDRILVWLQQFVIDLVRGRQTGANPDRSNGFGERLVDASVERLYRLYDKISHYRRISRDPLNQQLVIEDLLLTLQKTVNRTP